MLFVLPHEEKDETYWVPPHLLVAILTRQRLVRLNNIDEGCCTTALTTVCCSLCSITQTYRELSASGVWPGGMCNAAPPQVLLQQPGAGPRMK